MDFNLLSLALRIVLLIFIGLPILNRVVKVVEKYCASHFSSHVAMILAHTLYYAGMSVIIVTVLHECGFHVSALLGTAGILGIAVGFAAQTSIANIISGIFLLIEQPFCVGDIIECGGVSGTVHTIDLISIKIRTVNNTLVRISNTDLLKQNVINTTYFSKRRIGFELQLLDAYPYKEFIKEVEDLVYTHQYVLPKPHLEIFLHKIVKDPTTRHLETIYHLYIWTNKENVTQVKRDIMATIHAHYSAHNTPLLITLIN